VDDGECANDVVMYFDSYIGASSAYVQHER